MTAGKVETMLCPKCKVPMIYLMEAEKNATERRITRYYKCPACGTKVIVERLLIKQINGKLKVYNLMNGNKEIIYSRPVIRTKRSQRKHR